jgi:Thrombospondin C-terminal region
MLALRPARSPFAHVPRVLVCSAALCAAASAQLDLTSWSLFDPDNDWTFINPTTTSVRMVEQVGSSSVHPGWVVSDFSYGPSVTIEFDLSVSAGTGDDDIIGFGFSWLDGSHSYLLDWKKTVQSFNWGQPVVFNDDLAEAGMKIKRIDGAYSWDGLWGGQDGQGVTTVAGPVAGGWVAGTVYHFKVVLSPGHIVVTRDGVGIFDVLDASFPGGTGSIAAYAFSQNNTNLANVTGSIPTWTDLGQGMVGSTGVPELAGSGDLSASSLNQVTLSNAAPSSTATLVFGLAAIDAPFKGGTMVPHPLMLVPLATSAGGGAALPFVWPVGIPSDFSIYFQFWIQDGAATHGLSASNGLKGTTP